MHKMIEQMSVLIHIGGWKIPFHFRALQDAFERNECLTHTTRIHNFIHHQKTDRYREEIKIWKG